MAHELRPVTTPEDWQAMHDIRRATLFPPERHGGAIVYDEQHPDDRHPRNQPFLLLIDAEPAGVVRLDQRGEKDGVVRLVAILPARQGRGLGRVMDGLVADEARRRGMRRIVLNAHPSAVGFYEKTGWRRETWDSAELVGIASHAIQMVKLL